jgi:hypothetical protein
MKPAEDMRRSELKGRQHETALLLSGVGNEFAHFFDPNVAHFCTKYDDFADFFSAYLADICDIEKGKVASTFDVVTASGLRKL